MIKNQIFQSLINSTNSDLQCNLRFDFEPEHSVHKDKMQQRLLVCKQLQCPRKLQMTYFLKITNRWCYNTNIVGVNRTS